MENYKDLCAILTQELFENDLFNIDELAKKYNFSQELRNTLTTIYNQYFDDED